MARERFDSDDPGDLAPVIVRCATDGPLVVRTLLDAVSPVASAGARIAEFGFGPGWLLDELPAAFPRCHICGLDLSREFARRAHRRQAGTSIIVGDMESLPFADGAFDAIVTAWTLYFMSDIDVALAEARRCLRPGGVFVAATNARDHMLEYSALAADALRSSLGREPEQDVGERFDLTSGPPLIEGHFADVEIKEWHGELMIESAADALELWQPYGVWSLPAEENVLAMAEFERLAGRGLARGPLRVRRHGGVFIART